MTTALVRYEAARSALAEAHRVDEVKDIRDKAEAMAAYARQAKDSELIQYATEIKVRAERRCGELLTKTEKNTGTRVRAGVVVERSDRQTLSDMGLTKDESSRYQQLAAMPAEHFETAVATAKATAGEVTTAFMLREAAKSRPTGKPMKGKKADAIRAELAEAKQRNVSMLASYARLTLKAIEAQDEFTEEERELLTQLHRAIATTQLQWSVNA
jgi:hypothetical protein